MKYLKKGSVVLPVTECYAYRYDYGKGKTVLRVKIDASATTFAEVQEFFGEVSDFEQWDGNMENLETVYTDYGADLDIHYKKPTDEIQPDGSVQTQSAFYEIEVLRDPSLDASIRMLQKENAALRAEVAALQETNSGLEAEITSAQIALVDLYETMIIAEVG